MRLNDIGKKALTSVDGLQISFLQNYVPYFEENLKCGNYTLHDLTYFERKYRYGARHLNHQS